MNKQDFDLSHSDKSSMYSPTLLIVALFCQNSYYLLIASYCSDRCFLPRKREMRNERIASPALITFVAHKESGNKDQLAQEFDYCGG